MGVWCVGGVGWGVVGYMCLVVLCVKLLLLVLLD